MRENDILHATGTKLTASTAREALEEAGLANWNVRFDGLRTADTGLPVTEKRALVYDRPGHGPAVMATCGSRYEIVQTEEHADFLDAVVDFTGGKYDVAKSFKNDKIVMISLKMPETINVLGSDRVDLYLTAINSFDGTTPFMLILDPVRAACANQLNYFRHDAFRTFKIRHTRHIRGHVQLAREALGLLLTGMESFEEEANRLATQELTDAQFERIIEGLYPKPKQVKSAYSDKREQLTTLYRSGENNADITGTRWGGFNAVVEWLDWYRPVKSKTHELDRRAERIMVASEHAEEMERAFRAFATI